MLENGITPGAKVKYREGAQPPGLRNMGVLGEVLDREPKFSGHVYVRWPSGEETDEAPANLETFQPEGTNPVD